MKTTAKHVLTAIVVIAATSTFVRAQSIERTLDDEGQWQLTTADDQTQPSPTQQQLNRARQALAKGQASQARRMADSFIKDHPNDPLISQAYLVRAEARMRSKEYYKALYDFEYICRMYPGSESFSIALEREFEVAQIFASGTRRKVYGFRWLSAYEEAEELFIRIQERLPGSKLAQRAALALADHYYERRNMPLAATTYDVYIKNYPNAADLAQAMQRLIFAHLAGYRGPRFDTSGLDEANGWIDILKARHPAQAQQVGAKALTHRIEEARGEKILVDARWYLKRSDEVSARFLLNRLIKRHSTTLAATQGYEIMKQHGWINEATPQPTIGPTTTQSPAATNTDEEQP